MPSRLLHEARLTIRGCQTGVDGQVRAGRFRWGLGRNCVLWWVTSAFDRFVDRSAQKRASRSPLQSFSIRSAPFGIAPKQECLRERKSTTPLLERRLCILSILLVVIIVIVVLALLGFFGRGRFGR